MLTDIYKRLPLSSIIVQRDSRQRREIKTDGLLESIKRIGVINPVIITRDFVLVAGERRLEASRQLGLDSIPTRFVEELDSFELQVLELEENLKRSDLHWRDMVKAVGQLHSLYLANDETWTQGRTAESLSLSPASISTILRVFRDLDNPKIAGAPTLNSAYGSLSRLDERKLGDAMSELMDAGSEIFDTANDPPNHGVPMGATAAQSVPGLSHGATPTTLPTVKNSGVSSTSAPVYPSRPAPPPESILNADFRQWAPNYKGQPFNFVHCDFPYGINVFHGAMGAGTQATPGVKSDHKLNPDLYTDTPEVYWDLCKTLCDNLDRVMAYSAHLMFWFSMKHYHTTLEFFRQNAPSLVFNPTPLVWLKSDNKGVIPDVNRQPRNIYETAFLAAREDRFLVRPASNAYSAPTDKLFHLSAKPEPMLRVFFQMLVDENTRLFDPTCGGGSALRAAESLGAKQVLGLEINPDHCNTAQQALKQFRSLRKST